ncbi:putative zinc-binding metallopeptidase [Pseudoalteromonas sp. 5Ae-yellow]|uniref:putative zinc-binding metallopeptidase n=1 Tax=Pseudoalteromonas sp. 5Ae-yellow TaxID=2759847 RepID=UPI002174EEB9|nr:putative zinc-binding metallopeptidase [Pseudoalteromonas sp. 5Ae-yellow]
MPQSAYYFNSQTSIDAILDTWMEFSIILNSLNRSMGLADAYPFVLTQAVRTKLSFIHHAIHNRLNLMPDLSIGKV